MARGKQRKPTRAPYGVSGPRTKRKYISGAKTGNPRKGKATLSEVVSAWKRSLSPKQQRAVYRADKKRKPRR